MYEYEFSVFGYSYTDIIAIVSFLHYTHSLTWDILSSHFLKLKLYMFRFILGGESWSDLYIRTTYTTQHNTFYMPAKYMFQLMTSDLILTMNWIKWYRRGARLGLGSEAKISIMFRWTAALISMFVDMYICTYIHKTWKWISNFCFIS